MALSAKQFVEKLGLPAGALIYVGERKTEGLRLTRVHVNNGQTNVFVYHSWEICKSHLACEEGYIWLHVEGLADVRVIDEIGRYYGIHQLALEDVLNSHHRPKMSDFEDYVQYIFKIVSVDPIQPDIFYEHAAILMGQKFLISFQERRSDFFSKIRERLLGGDQKLCRLGPAYLAFALLDFAVDHYYLASGRMESAVDHVEADILRDRDSRYLEMLYDLKWETTLLKKISTPTRDFVRAIVKRPPALIDEEVHLYYRDLEDHAVQVVDVTDGIRETLENLFSVSEAHLAHRRNTTMSILTAVSTIFLPLNFFAGIFGMNFAHIPFASSYEGFYYAFAAMTAVGVVMAIIFRWKRWL